MLDDRKKTVSELIFSDRDDVRKMVDEECKSKFNFELSDNFSLLLIILQFKTTRIAN